jgi:TetR/AcrR family transcriptional regulator, cholesterol catabolism regulator
MEELQEKESKVVENATGIFMKYGIKSVNMDDMSRYLGMSKKTLYLFVKDKEDLVRKAVAHFCTKEDIEIRNICHQGLNAIDESLEIMRWVLNVLKNVHPSVNFDLEKYHPEVAKAMKDNRHRAIYDCIRLNMKKGQREGLYRKDFNAEVIAKMYIARIDIIFDQDLFPLENHNLSDLYREMFKYHIRGIASTDGLEYLKEKMKQLKY